MVYIMDRRYICYLTSEGVKNINEQLQHLKNVKLPRTRELLEKEPDRKQYQLFMKGELQQILRLNQMIHYNSNPESRVIEYPSMNEVRHKYKEPVYSDRTSPDEILADRISLIKDIIRQSAEERQVLYDYETNVIPVALLIVGRIGWIDRELPKYKQELDGLLSDAHSLNLELDQV